MPATAKRLLLLAYHFPPDPSIGGVRPAHFCRHLPGLGWEPQVMTAAAQNPPLKASVRAFADLFPEHNRGTLAWHRERLLRKLFFPGHLGIGWAQPVAEAGVAWAREQKRMGVKAALLSSYPPLGVHLAAMRIQKKTGMPWIADFRDPLGYDPTGQLSPLARGAQRWLERAVFERADVILANTDTMAERWRSAYPKQAGKIHVIWNGYDAADEIGPAAVPQRAVRWLTHLGSLYTGRHPGAVTEALAALIDAGKLAAGSVVVRQIGPSADTELDRSPATRRAQREGWLQLDGSKPQAEAFAVAQASDVLLLLQPQSDHQVPGKLFEYLRLGRPILAVVPRNSPIEMILSQSGVPYRCLYPELGAEAAGRMIEELLALPGGHYPASEWFFSRFSAAARTRTLVDLLESVTI